MFSKAIQSALLGLVAGGLAFAVSFLFTYHAIVDPNKISFADWASRGVLGAFVCATVAAILTHDQQGPGHGVRAFLMGLATGALAGAVAEVLYELLEMKMFPGAERSDAFGQLFSIPIYCAMYGLAIFLACGPNAYRIKRTGVAIAGMIIPLVVIMERLHRWHMLSILVTWKLPESTLHQPNIHFIEFLLVGALAGFVYSMVELTLQPPSLRLILGQGRWKSWPLVNARYEIGNEPDADIRVTAKIRAHVVRNGERYMILDQGEGMIVNNQPVKQHNLLPGDVIQLGDVTFVYGIYTGRGSTLHLPMANLQEHRLVDSFGNVFALKPGQAIIGRDKAADIAVTWDDRASRQHAKLDLIANEVFLSDLGSRNGTLVEGTPIAHPVRILPGNKIQIGSTEFTYLA